MPPRSPARRWAVRALQLSLTALVTGFILHRVGLSLEEVRGLDSRWWRPDAFLFLLSSLVLCATYFLSALLWAGIVRELGGEGLNVRRAFRIHFTANLGRYVPGKVLQIAGLAFLAGRAGIRVPAALGGALLGQGLTLVGATVVGFAAFRALGGEGGAGLGRLGTPGLWAGLVTVALIVAVTIPPLFRALVRLAARLVRIERPPIVRLSPSFGSRWTALYVLLWVMYALAFWILARSLGVDGGPFEVGPAFAAAYLLGYLAVFAPAGLGVREGFLVAFLEPITGAAPALALAVIARLWMTVVELVPALVFAGLELREGRRMGNGP